MIKQFAFKCEVARKFGEFGLYQSGAVYPVCLWVVWCTHQWTTSALASAATRTLHLFTSIKVDSIFRVLVLVFLIVPYRTLLCVEWLVGLRLRYITIWVVN